MSQLWQPDQQCIDKSQITAFRVSLEATTGRALPDYPALHRWSIEHPADFWAAIWDWCDIQCATPYSAVVHDLDCFPGTRWFPGARLNFAENLMRYQDERIAITGLLENGHRRQLTYRQLWQEVERLASAMRRFGIEPGDRIAGLLPNVPETLIAMLATTSLGAIWSSCSPDFGIEGAVDRFGQIEPRLLFTSDACLYNGKVLDCLEKATGIAERVPSIEQVIVCPLVDSSPAYDGKSMQLAQFIGDETPLPLTFAQMPFDHPLYIMYSSGTTGVPKCIVHSAGGTLIQHLKEHRLHVDLRRDDTLFYFTTCGWMMWNWLVSGLASGCTLVLYDGSPFARQGKALIDAIDEENISVFGTSARYLSAIEKEGLKPRQTHGLQRLRMILSTGSPLGPASFEYVYRDFKQDVCLSSISGGTDIIACFMLGNPTLPVHAGEIQCLGLGMAAEFWDAGERCLPGTTGELVCTRPFPSVPVGFWNDPQGHRFRQAYFVQHPGVWTHGDYGELTENGGAIIHGRSDAVLNPSGVRIGTAEIYRQVETLDEVIDAVVVSQDWDGDERIILFVVLRPGISLDDRFRDRIRQTIRSNTTPRHVPAKIIEVGEIPRTISGKVVELAVRKVIHGETVDNLDVLANPEALKSFENLPELARP